MRKGLLAILLWGGMLGGTAFAADVSIRARVVEPVGIYVQAPPPPLRVVVQSRRPGRDYVWVPGYYVTERRGYRWVEGAWVLPPRHHATWVEPHYRDHHYFPGYWR